MRAFSVSLDSSSPLVVFSHSVPPPIPLVPTGIPTLLSTINASQFVVLTASRLYCNCTDSPSSSNSTDYDDENEIDSDEVTDDYLFSSDEISDSSQEDGVYIEIERLGKRTRRIRAKIAIEASLDTIWDILTDYEKLADFIPGLAVSQLVEKREKFARLYQIGQQNLLFGLKFNAKGILDCYEKDLENFPSGKRRDIEFKMTEGDFQLFEGKWTIKQVTFLLSLSWLIYTFVPSNF
ncbi:uncharacterized protein LOC120003750 isoform X1 [Tripterygium wilfordii]|uniref:uncharacterized protein LOC120003750 isoform X1 n=1 Tax=Tripterygium wilfordii TaxID=458696 RepID=UPI0018F8529C|nr:uncharacterized protein LOC120003750 isoform X1 [Tripterygium wilfordii]